MYNGTVNSELLINIFVLMLNRSISVSEKEKIIEHFLLKWPILGYFF